MRAKKSVRVNAKKSAASKRSTSVTRFTRAFQGAIGSQSVGVRAMLVAGICIMGAAMVIAARQPSQPALDIPGGRAAADTSLAADLTASTPSYAEPIASGTFRKAEPVTITGCLEQRDEAFRLKDTAGEDAPKSRSWKSGFLKKRAAAIDVVDSGRRLKLPAHVGERVSVTGVMMNREMQARSLQRVGAACN